MKAHVQTRRPVIAGRKGQRGQSLLEVAFVTPLILALVLGVIELGRYAYVAILVGNAARAGAAYGAQSIAQSVCPPSGSCGIQIAADNDYKNNGQDPTKLAVSGGFGGSYAACTCDSGGTYSPDPAYPSYCDPPPTGTNNSAGSCPSGSHWVVLVSVEAKGTFRSLFNYPGIPSPVTIDRTATLRVAVVE